MLPTRLSDYRAVRLAIRSRFIHMATSLMVNDIWDFSETYKDIYTYVHVETYLMHFKMKSYPHFYLLWENLMNQYRSKINWHATENQNSSGIFFLCWQTCTSFISTQLEVMFCMLTTFLALKEEGTEICINYV